MKKIAAEIVSIALQMLIRALTAVRGIWVGVAPEDKPRIYYANHTSNGDFVLIWTSLPADIRRKTRPVAAADYWFKSKTRRFAVEEVFNAVLIDRNKDNRQEGEDPVDLMTAALQQGQSLIIFPEGKRNQTEEKLLEFRTGLYHFLRNNPGVEAIPTWIENLNRVLPKGTLLPIPLICTVTFGPPVVLERRETKKRFLARAHAELLKLADMQDRGRS